MKDDLIPFPTHYISVPKYEAESLDSLAYIINDWAEKKGWNRSDTPDQLRAKFKIGLLMLDLEGFTVAVEAIRKGNGIPANPATRDTQKLTPLQLRKLSQIALIVTELWEMAEGVITGAQDDHCPQLPLEHAEAADTFIRMFHYCGEHEIPIGKTLMEKHEYNVTRPERHGGKLA